MDPELRIPLESKLVRSAAAEGQKDLLVFCDEVVDEEREAELRARGVEVHRLPRRDERLDLRVALDVLNGHHHIRSVLAEAGSALNGSLLRDQLADKVVLYFAEQELGEVAIPFAEGTSPYLLQERLSSVERETFPNGDGEDVRVSGYVHDPWAGL
jgi:diaminohydroxyphosphoribosylaminopyrimidine deaminase/5-amino-6-(5-phosphoribosylamino)uracil reductase